VTTNPTPTHHAGTEHPAPPTLREIADLTARLRASSTPGRAVDPAERAAFLADTHAPLAGDEAQRRDRGPDVVGLVCGECGDDATEHPTPDAAGRPVYVHPDGEPLCPAPGDHRPAPPVEVLAEPDDRVQTAHAAVTRALAGVDPPTADEARHEQLTAWHHDTRDAHHRNAHVDEAGTP